jgi:hypothetical protein
VPDSELVDADKPERQWKTRLLKGQFPDRRFDIEFWQAQGEEAIFEAAWEMVVLAEEPTLQRTVTHLERMRR